MYVNEIAKVNISHAIVNDVRTGEVVYLMRGLVG